MICSRRGLCIGALLLMPASVANAQVPWETPQLLAPHAPRGVSLLAISYAAAPGDGWGVAIAWRGVDVPSGWGYRMAAGEGRDGSKAVAAGVETSAWVTHASATFPLDVIWSTGFGGSYGSSVQLALPVGFAVGRSLGTGRVWFNPYITSRAIIEGRLDRDGDDDELELQLATEIGADLSFDRARRFVVRVAAALGDRSAVAAGVHLDGGRRDDLQASVQRGRLDRDHAHRD